MIRDTSHSALRSVRRCAPEMRAKILGALRASPAPLCDEELIEITGLAPSSLRPRRVELVESGEVIAAPVTKTTKSGRKAIAWTAAVVA